MLQAPAMQVIAKAFKIVLVTESEDWRQLIIDCLNNMHHIEDEASTTRMTARARIYTLYTDGAWGHLGARAFAVLIPPSGLHTKYVARLEFKATII